MPRGGDIGKSSGVRGKADRKTDKAEQKERRKKKTGIERMKRYTEREKERGRERERGKGEKKKKG